MFTGPAKMILATLDHCQYLTVTGKGFKVADGRIAMGIPWMIGRELSQAIPPAYTRWIGERLLQII